MHQYAFGPSERSALASTPFQKGGKNSFKKPFRSNHEDKENILWKGGSIDKDKLHCSHCGKMSHTCENCWDLIGRPEKFSKPGNGRANSVT